MKWNFPIKKTIKCKKCGKKFDITLRHRGKESHVCPHCGNNHISDTDVIEKDILKEAKKELGKHFKRIK